MNAGVIITIALCAAFVYWMWRILPTSKPARRGYLQGGVWHEEE